MRKMTCPLILVALGLVPAEGRAQPIAAKDRGAFDALVVEVRLLRQALERQTAVAVRSQLLVSRLTVQHQRVARAQDAVDRIVEALSAADRKHEQTREALAKVTGVLAYVTEEPRRSELEREVEADKAELADHDRQVAELRTRRSQAEQSLRTEQQLYGELEASLSGLDRQLQRPGS